MSLSAMLSKFPHYDLCKLELSQLQTNNIPIRTDGEGLASDVVEQIRIRPILAKLMIVQLQASTNPLRIDFDAMIRPCLCRLRAMDVKQSTLQACREVPVDCPVSPVSAEANSEAAAMEESAESTEGTLKRRLVRIRAQCIPHSVFNPSSSKAKFLLTLLQ
jgi:hypothetical protein